jgi:phosphinothricin acetyltransferase
MYSSCVIRPVVERDFPAIAALTNHFILNTAIHFGTVAHLAEELLAQWQEHAVTHPYIVAVRDTPQGQELLGFAKVSVWRSRAAYAHTCESGIYIAPHVQRQGLGKALYLDLIARTRLAGFHTIVAAITVPNEPSCRLHEAVGFRHIGTFEEVGFKFDKWWGTTWYQLML